jgi:hypothetical protein
MRKALAIGHHLARERSAHLVSADAKAAIVRADLHAARARRQQQNGVVGRSVAVDGDAIEADLDRGAKIRVQICGSIAASVIT